MVERVYGEYPENTTKCIKHLTMRYRHMFTLEMKSHEYQCTRKRGHGKDGLYCKQHSKMKADTK